MAGAWYELTAQMSKPGPEGDKVLAAIAEASEDTLASYKEQLSTTHMFYTAPSAALEMTKSAQLKKTMELVRQFCFIARPAGRQDQFARRCGHRFPDGSVQGKKDRVRLRFDASYMQMAAGRASCERSPDPRAARRATVWILSWFLFATGIVSYFWVSRDRHRENPDDRVMPTLQQMGRAFADAALKPAEDEEVAANADQQSLVTQVRNSMLWKDTMATGRRFLISMALLFPAVLLGLHMGMFPYVGTFFLRFVLFFDKIVALSLLPILFIAFGIDELAKVMLIVIGVAPTIILDAFNLTRGVPQRADREGIYFGRGRFLRHLSHRIQTDLAARVE